MRHLSPLLPLTGLQGLFLFVAENLRGVQCRPENDAIWECKPTIRQFHENAALHQVVEPAIHVLVTDAASALFEARRWNIAAAWAEAAILIDAAVSRMLVAIELGPIHLEYDTIAPFERVAKKEKS